VLAADVVRRLRMNSGIGALDVFIGSWRTSGTIFSDSEQTRLSASDVYEWFPGQDFILHHVDGSMGGALVKALEILRYDEVDEGLVSQAIDNNGQYTEYKLRLFGHRWEIIGASERFEGEFNEDFTRLEGQWFTVRDGQDREWMQIKFEKVEN
jgi:hypothetical protein